MSREIHIKLLSKSENLTHLKKIITYNGCLTLEKKPKNELFSYLARTAAGQQLSNKAANTIWGRVKNEGTINNLSLMELFVDENRDKLRTCGLSKSKIKAILELREAITNETLNKEIYKSPSKDFIINEITKLWGFGQWSAEMSAIFFFALPNIWSNQDVALNRGITLISEKDAIEPENILKLYSPYLSYLSLHIWKALDNNIL